MASKNAVVKRIDQLTRCWRQFTDQPAARILRLRLATDAARMVDCFLAFHNEEESDLDDLFLPVVVPANDVDEYWGNVLAEIHSEIEDARDDLTELEIPTDWQPPQFASGTPPAQQLISTLGSFHSHYADLFDHAGLVLLPTAVDSRELWIECMDALIRVSEWPASVRVVAPDWMPETILQDWSVEHATFVHSASPRLDMPGLPLELLAHLPGTGPAFEFRRLFVQLGAAAALGQAALVTRFAEQALRIATDQGWYSLAATVQLLTGSAAVTSAQPQQALGAYRSARQLAASIDDPSGPKVSVTSTFAEASALLSNGEFEQARQIYREAARQSDEAGETLSSMEARRMASYCSESCGELDAAWREGQEALQVARQLDSDSRADSTLPALMHRMQEIAQRPEMSGRNLSIDRECAELLGNEWTGVLERTKTLLSKA